MGIHLVKTTFGNSSLTHTTPTKRLSVWLARFGLSNSAGAGGVFNDASMLVSPNPKNVAKKQKLTSYGRDGEPWETWLMRMWALMPGLRWGWDSRRVRSLLPVAETFGDGAAVRGTCLFAYIASVVVSLKLFNCLASAHVEIRCGQITLHHPVVSRRIRVLGKLGGHTGTTYAGRRDDRLFNCVLVVGEATCLIVFIAVCG